MNSSDDFDHSATNLPADSWCLTRCPDLAGETLERQSAPNYILRQRTIPMTTASAPSSLMAQGFSRLVTVEDPFHADELMSERSDQLCAELESGNLVVLPRSPIVIPDEHRSLLLAWKQASSPYHKNIAYRPLEDRLTGLEASEQGEAGQLRRILRAYSQRAAEFLSAFLPPYAGNWKLDYVSYRPIEEKARPARLHARNDLVHFDSFPTRPTNGARILRFFTNINPQDSRVWVTSQTFEALGPRFAAAAVAGASSPFGAFARGLRHIARVLHLPGSFRPPYDELMHCCHNLMKEDESFQKNTPKQRWEFAPNSSWIAFTDCVSHAVLSGQFALEQTFLIPQNALVSPHRSPLAILEKFAGRPLTF